MRSGLTRTRLDDAGRQLGTRVAVAKFSDRGVTTVRRYCMPVACDVATRADLYDADDCVRQLTVMARFLCCIEDGDGNRCGSPVIDNAPVAVCQFHAELIGRFIQGYDRLKTVRQRLAATHATGIPAVDRETTDQLTRRNNVVYYLQVGTHVKIGTTGNLAERLRAYPPTSRLLATEPGGYALESERHVEFREYLVAGNEWFDPGPKLRAHVERLMAKADAPARRPA